MKVRGGLFFNAEVGSGNYFFDVDIEVLPESLIEIDSIFKSYSL